MPRLSRAPSILPDVNTHVVTSLRIPTYDRENLNAQSSRLHIT